MIINAEFTAGQTIEDAVREALEFAERNNCMVRATLNDIPMLFFNSSLIGGTMEERVQFFINHYKTKLDSGNGISDCGSGIQ